MQVRSVRFNALAAALALAALSAPAFAGQVYLGNLQDQGNSRFIVKFRSGSAPAGDAKSLSGALNRAAERVALPGAATGPRLRTVRAMIMPGARVVASDRALDRAQAAALIRQIAADENVEFVQLDGISRMMMTPNDPSFAQQWHYADSAAGIRLPTAWNASTGAGVVVAVIDSGIASHTDLNANILPGYDFIEDPEVSVDGDGRDADPNDPGDWHDGECNIFGIPEDSSWHGTHVAGTIAAVTNNGVGVAGVAPNAKVQPVRVLGKCGGYTSDIIDAVTWASGGSVTGVPDNATPAEVINLSLGGSGACSAAEQTAFAAARARGTTVVIAAGNSSGDVANFSPANCDNVIAVSAVGPTGSLASYSNFGNKIDVAAPGGSGAQPAADNILSTLNLGLQGQEGEGYAWMAGTSMAAPHVAGVVALMQSAAATPKTPAEIEKILVNTAHVGGQPGGCSWSNWCGSGIVDARYAVAVAKGSEALPPDPQVPEPEPATELENGITVTNIEVGANGILRYQLLVPNGASNLLFAMYGGTGDSDIYVKYGAEPTSTSYDCRPFTSSNNETCFFPTPKGGVWYVQIKGYRASAGISLYPSFVDANYPRRLEAKASALPNHRTSVNLSWEKGKKNIDIWRNGAILKTVRNTGANTDTFRIIGSGTMSYKVCNNGTQECDDPVEITYNSSR